MGRRLLKDEISRNEVIDLSWRTLKKALISSRVSAAEKRRIALEIAKKSVPQDINLGAQNTLKDALKALNGCD